ncbi:hypothetical protein L9F63_003716, partial [Diploptera punctata]
LQGSRSPGLYTQHIPKIRTHQELRLLLTPPPDFRTDDFRISENTARRTSHPDDYRYLQPLGDENYLHTSQYPEPIYVKNTRSDIIKTLTHEDYIQSLQYPEPLDTPTLPKPYYIKNKRSHEKESFKRSEEPNEEKDCYNRCIAPPSDLIGIPLEKEIKKAERNNSDIHTIKIEGRINSKTLIKSKACSLSKLNITNVIVSDCSDREFTERLYQSEQEVDDLYTNDNYSEESDGGSEDFYTDVNLDNTSEEEDGRVLDCKENIEKYCDKNKNSGSQENIFGNSDNNQEFKEESINKNADSNVDNITKIEHGKDNITNLERQLEDESKPERTRYRKHNEQRSSKINVENCNNKSFKEKGILESNLGRQQKSAHSTTKDNYECFLGLRAKIIRNYLSQEEDEEENCEYQVNNNNKNNKDDNKDEDTHIIPFDARPVKEKAAKFQEISNNIYDRIANERQIISDRKRNTSNDRKSNLEDDKYKQKQKSCDKINIARTFSADSGNLSLSEAELSNRQDKEDNKANNGNARLIYNYMRGKPKRSESLREVKSENRNILSNRNNNSRPNKVKTTFTRNSYDLNPARAKSLDYLSTSIVEENTTTTPKHEDKCSSVTTCRNISSILKSNDYKDALSANKKINNDVTESNKISEISKNITEGELSVKDSTSKIEEVKDNSSKELLKEENMSRRPQVLKITDSATTSSPPKCLNGERKDTSGYGVIRQRTPDIGPTSEENTNVTRKMKTIFEGTPPVCNEKEEKSEDVEDKCEKISTAKPMLIATLSVEDGEDTLKKPNTKKESSSVQEFNSQTLPANKPAFRAFSCNAKENLSDINKSVPEFLNVSKKKTNSKDKIPTMERDYKVAAFDGLLQYLQDYRHGLRELLVNNNVVIIEPVRQSKVKLEDKKYAARKSSSESTCRITGATIKSNSVSSNPAPGSNTLPRQQKSQQPVLRRHFFYHPKRTNRELLDEELPDPDKVRNAREMFERTLKMKTPSGETFKIAVNAKCEHEKPPAKSVNDRKYDNTNANKAKRKYLTVDTVFRHNILQKKWTDTGSLSSGVSSDLSCYDTDLESPCSRGDNFSRNSNHKEEMPDIFSSDDNEYADDSDSKHCYLDDGDEGHYVSPEVLEKIRACGTTVTYYGGQVISSSNGPVRSPMTLAIMNEIRNSKTSVKNGKEIRIMKDEYVGMKFRLVKSNSCSSRLELAGTEDEGNFRDDWCSTEDKLEDCKVNDEPTIVKCEPKQSAIEANQREESKLSTIEEKTQEEKMSTIEALDSAFKRRDEVSAMFGKPNMYENFQKGGASRLCFSPDKVKLIEKGSNVFDDMEFEEFEIADDSLNIIEEDKKVENQKNEETGSAHDVVEKSKELPLNASTNSNEDVQMTTWASRSVLFDFRNSESDSTHLPRQNQDCSQSTC